MKTSERLRFMHQITKRHRGLISGEPSEATKKEWERYDAQQEFIISLYERREAAEAAAEAAAAEKENDAITLTTEVKIK